MAETIGIRKAKSDDYPAFHAVCDNHLPHPLSLEERLEQRKREFGRIDDGSVVAFLAEVGGEAAGSVQLRLGEHQKEEGRIHALIVRQDVRRKGIASQLMDAVEEEGKSRKLSRLWLTVHTTNSPARCFYASQGYSVVDQQEELETLEKNLETLG